MTTFFTRQRYGRPQFIAGALLLFFLGQCLWLIRTEARTGQPSKEEIVRIAVGLQYWHGESPGIGPNITSSDDSPMVRAAIAQIGADRNRSRLPYLISASPFALWPALVTRDSLASWIWLARMPYLMIGALLGASVWYVARRLYGNAGGYIALGLYCFSPAIIRSTSLWSSPPEMSAAWGTFGSIFTGIAVAHTLYAPREVVLWNWRRILLLGLSFALAIGSQYSLLLIAPVALGFMLYVAPTRRLAALAIWVSACVAALLIMFAAYGLHFRDFYAAAREARFFDIRGAAFLVAGTYLQAISNLVQASPALTIAFPAALGVYLFWRRPRYFGNTAPLLVVVILLFCSLGSVHFPGMGFSLMVVPFLFVFVAGVAADLLETKHREIVLSSIWGLLLAGAAWNLLQLARA